MSGFGESMTPFEAEMWNGGYGPAGAWWQQSEEGADDSHAPADPLQAEIERLKAKIEGLEMYVLHEVGCKANDLDPLDRSPCTCGLRRYCNPKGLPA